MDIFLYVTPLDWWKQTEVSDVLIDSLVMEAESISETAVNFYNTIRHLSSC
jgi:hypothetical protein